MVTGELQPLEDDIGLGVSAAKVNSVVVPADVLKLQDIIATPVPKAQRITGQLEFPGLVPGFSTIVDAPEPGFFPDNGARRLATANGITLRAGPLRLRPVALPGGASIRRVSALRVVSRLHLPRLSGAMQNQAFPFPAPCNHALPVGAVEYAHHHPGGGRRWLGCITFRALATIAILARATDCQQQYRGRGGNPGEPFGFVHGHPIMENESYINEKGKVMKTPRFILLIVLMIGSSLALADFPEEDDPDASPDEAEVEERTFEIVVRGLPSGFGPAWKRIQPMADIDGLNLQSVDADRNRIVVRSGEQPSRSAITEALQNSGISVVYITERS